MQESPDKPPSHFDDPGTGTQVPTLGFFQGRAGRRRRLLIVTAALALVCFFSIGAPSTGTEPAYNGDGSVASPVEQPVEKPVEQTPPPSPPKVDPSEELGGAVLEDLSTITSQLDPKVHPLEQLTDQAQKSLKEKLSRQSKTLEEAVANYKKRYGMPPPPNFDQWFTFAKKNNYLLIDEFDTIYENLLPYWGLKPATLRARTANALGYPNALLGVSIRDGLVTHSKGSREWQVDATTAMLAKFSKWLPDMDLAFNVNDEPRIQIQHDDLSRLVQRGRNRISSLNSAKTVNEWSKSPIDLNPGRGFTEVKSTVFNEYPRQATWTVSRMSCPPDSPVRALDGDAPDDLSTTCHTPLCFVRNTTSQSDICQSPSLANTYGFFVAPNAYTISHDLIPIFSQSKYSTYADILYPSPWYWADKVIYNQSHDRPWEKKEPSMYWRGSTTGGFSTLGWWRHQHRQRMIEGLNNPPSTSQILTNNGSPTDPNWSTIPLNPNDIAPAVNVSFTHVGQCDEGDCAAQKDHFVLAPYATPQDGWAHRYVLDIDGNAFSGRFYSFLQSQSLPVKYAIAREWHSERIMPWVHYVPITLTGHDWWEILRWLRGEPKGQKWAPEAAEEGRKWAAKTLRKVDMEIWFFRLLLEYGRIIDDNRENLAYTGPTH